MTVEIYGPSKTHTVSGETVTFMDDSASTVSSFVAQIDRNGLGGRDGVTISRNGTTQTVSFGKTVYEGSVNVTSGTLTETYGGGPYYPTNIPSEISSAVEENMTLETASGAIAQFDCELGDYPAQNVTIAIQPVQSGSGDPSPDNVRPITGWTGAKVTRTGKNLYNPQTANDGKILWAGGSLADNSRMTTSDFIKVSAGAIYVQNALAATVGRTCAIYDKDKTFIRIAAFQSITVTSGVITINSGEEFVRVSSYLSDKDAIMVELGSTATVYEPYQGETYNITFPSEAGTVYGGELDVTTGVLTVTHASVDMGTLTRWGVNESYAHRLFTLPYLGDTRDRKNATPIICSMYPVAPGAWGITSFGNNGPDNSIAYHATDAGVWVRDDSFATLEEFLAAVTGQTIVYELATPQTYQLTPQEIQLLAGENNLWADTGDSTVEYYDGDITSTDILTESGALISGETAIYPLATPLVSSITPASVPTVSGTNVMSANTGSITVSWATHWFDITPWIAWQGLTFSRNDVDAPDAGRDMSGYMHRGRVAVKEKMNISTVPLTKSQVSTLQSLLKPATIQVRVTPYPETNATKAMYMYSNNVKTTYIIHRESGEDIQSLSFPLIEL